jgi:hypothetical protein
MRERLSIWVINHFVSPAPVPEARPSRVDSLNYTRIARNVNNYFQPCKTDAKFSNPNPKTKSPQPNPDQLWDELARAQEAAEDNRNEPCAPSVAAPVAHGGSGRGSANSAGFVQQALPILHRFRTTGATATELKASLRPNKVKIKSKVKNAITRQRAGGDHGMPASGGWPRTRSTGDMPWRNPRRYLARFPPHPKKQGVGYTQPVARASSRSGGPGKA